MYICDISLFLPYLTPFEHMFIIASILTAMTSNETKRNVHRDAAMDLEASLVEQY